MPAESSAPRRIDAIDALRGVACLWVVLYHFGMWWGGAAHHGWPKLVAEQATLLGQAAASVCRFGYLGVSLFLCLSGFCLYHPIASRARAARRVEIGKFFRRRARRLLPPYYASLAVLTLLSALPATRYVVMQELSWLDVTAHALLIHNLIPDTIWTVNGAYWTLALEWQLYLVFPLLVLIARRYTAWAAALTALGVGIGWHLGLRATGHADVSGTIYGVLFESLPARWFEFATGLLAAELVADGRRVSMAFLLALVPVFVPFVWAVRAARLWDFPWDTFACGVSFGALVLAANHASARVVSSLPVRALRAVGEVSYSLYLVHQPLQLALRPLLQGYVQSLLGAELLGLAFGLPVLLGVATLFYRLFEAPFLRSPARSIVAA